MIGGLAVAAISAVSFVIGAWSGSRIGWAAHREHARQELFLAELDREGDGWSR